MTVNNNNNIVTPVSSLDNDDNASDIHEWYYSKLLHGQHLSALDMERLKDNRQSIPLLDRSLAESSSSQRQPFMLVRIRGGFVQDMFASEYFETTSSSSSSSDMPHNNNTNNNHGSSAAASCRPGGPTFAERTPILITPIPFSTHWFRNVLSEKQQVEEHRIKRARGNGEDGGIHNNINNNNNMMMMMMNDNQQQQQQHASNSNDDNDESSTWWDAETMKSDPDQVPVLAQFYFDQYRWETAQQSSSSSSPEQQQQHANDNNNKVRLNDIVEMIGILENHHDDGNDIDQDDMLAGDDGMMDVEEGETFWDDTATTTPPRHIPRLHVLWFDLLDFDTIAAHQAQCQNSIVLPPNKQEQHSEHDNGSDDNDNTASQLLASALEMDHLSATALYLNLLSMAERQPNNSGNDGPRNTVTKTTLSGATLGCCSLHLILPNHESCCRFQHYLENVLSQIVPAITSIHMDEGISLSTKSMLLPAKKQGRIQPTLLQLPQGSTLIINTSSSSSNNNTVAITDPSMSQALEMLTMNHHLPYHFDGGITIPFEADVRVIVLSSAAATDSNHRPKLPCTIQAKCCFQSNHEHADVDDDDKNNNSRRRLSEEQATFLRQCLARARGGASNNNNIDMPSAVLERAQDDFIQRRTAFREREQQQQQGSSGIMDTTHNNSSSSRYRHLPDEMDFHRWLTWTRLLARQGRGNKIAACAGLDNVVNATIQDWERALALDEALMDSVMS